MHVSRLEQARTECGCIWCCCREIIDGMDTQRDDIKIYLQIKRNWTKRATVRRTLRFVCMHKITPFRIRLTIHLLQVANIQCVFNENIYISFFLEQNHLDAKTSANPSISYCIFIQMWMRKCVCVRFIYCVFVTIKNENCIKFIQSTQLNILFA